MVLYRGLDIGSPEGTTARARSVAMVHRETALLPDLTVAENIHLAHLSRGAAWFNVRDAARAAEAALTPIDASFARQALHRRVSDLTLHERQLVEIARVLSAGAQLLLLDEPTANLTAAETKSLFALPRRLSEQRRLSIVFVSHRMREIREVATVCTVLRDGRSAISRAKIAELSDGDIIAMMGQATALDGASRPQGRKSRAIASSATFRVEYGTTQLEVLPGLIIGLAGAPAGPLELIDTLTGARRGSGWRVSRGGHAIALHSPRQAIRLGIGFVSGDRAGKGLLASLSILDKMLAAPRILQRRILVTRRDMRESAELLRSLRITTASLWALPATLSGGTQQTLLIARWINLAPSLLVLKEPTCGVDIGTKRDLYALVHQMAERGVGILWWSTEYAELVELCDAVLAFNPDGVPAGIFCGKELNEACLAQAPGIAA